MSDFLISIIIPVLNEAKIIPGSLRGIDSVLNGSDISHEFIMIDDGSTDTSWKTIKECANQYRLQAIRLSRNFGKEAALCAGLERTSGQAAVIMDADLQHPPELLPEMVRLWRMEGYEIVEAVKTSRGKENFIHRLGALAFYKLLYHLSGIDLNQASDYKLLDARVVASWRRMGESHTFFRGMAAWMGYRRIGIPYSVPDRKQGDSKWTALKLFNLALTAITSFSALPLQIITALGILFLIGSIPLGFQTLQLWFRGLTVSGFTTVILLLLIIGSLIMISLGIIGTYLAKIFDEVKHRPRYLVSESFQTRRIDMATRRWRSCYSSAFQTPGSMIIRENPFEPRESHGQFGLSARWQEGGPLS